MRAMWSDVRFGVRMLWKHRLSSLLCIFALALGMGATISMFSLAEAFLLHPVPFENAHRLVAVLDASPQQDVALDPVAPATFRDWTEQSRSLDRMAAYAWQDLSITGDREPVKLQAFAVTAGFFPLLGVEPLIGRTFLPEEEQSGKDQAIILAYGLWERHYASDPAVLGRTIKVNGKGYTIVGVMKKGFDYPMPAEAWVPLAIAPQDRERRDTRYLYVLAHLKDGSTINDARAEMGAISERQAQAYPETAKGWHLRVVPLAEFATGSLTRQFTFLLLGAVGFVLLIACANVANVQFARVSGRFHEFAVRTALGGSRWRLARQVLIECVLLSLLSAVLALLLAQWQLDLMLKNMPPDTARFIAGWKTIRLDQGAFLFAFVAALGSGVLAGLLPSLVSSKAGLSETLKEKGRGATTGRGRHRLRRALVVAEVSLSLILVVGAGLLVKGFHALLAANDAASPETLLTLNVSLPEAKYGQRATRVAFHDQVLEGLAALPGVTAASMASAVPYAYGGFIGQDSFTVEGRVSAERSESVSAILEVISPNYFRTMNIGLRDGREFAAGDSSESARVAAVSQSLARKYFEGQNPLGHRIKLGKPDGSAPWMTIVGVVNDVHYNWIEKGSTPTLYLPAREAAPASTTYVLRMPGDPISRVSDVRAVVARVDPDIPLYNIKTLDHVISESVVGIAYVAAMMAVLGVISLVLASLGVYGVMSHAVGERTSEIGIRMSLGAQSRDILRLVLGDGMFMALLGVVIGLPVAFLLSRALASILFGVQAADPVAFVGLTALLASVAALACYIPARRATRIDPLDALRYE